MVPNPASTSSESGCSFLAADWEAAPPESFPRVIANFNIDYHSDALDIFREQLQAQADAMTGCLLDDFTALPRAFVVTCDTAVAVSASIDVYFVVPETDRTWHVSIAFLPPSRDPSVLELVAMATTLLEI